MKSTKTLAAISSMLLVLSAVILGTSAFAISDLRDSVTAGTLPTPPIQPNRGSFIELPGRSGAAITDLALYPVAQEVQKGNTVILAGKLSSKSGEVLEGMEINIIDHSASSRSSSHSSTFDAKVIASVFTDSEGLFEAEWTPNASRAYTIVAQFDGSQGYLSSKSDKIIVSVH